VCVSRTPADAPLTKQNSLQTVNEVVLYVVRVG
jgi:hypothetical protein